MLPHVRFAVRPPYLFCAFYLFALPTHQITMSASPSSRTAISIKLKSIMHVLGAQKAACLLSSKVALGKAKNFFARLSDLSTGDDSSSEISDTLTLAADGELQFPKARLVLRTGEIDEDALFESLICDKFFLPPTKSKSELKPTERKTHRRSGAITGLPTPFPRRDSASRGLRTRCFRRARVIPITSAIFDDDDEDEDEGAITWSFPLPPAKPLYLPTIPEESESESESEMDEFFVVAA
ncbi:hypothetical protein BOTBODRAFT_64811 [Botryobasidium botryosum FD-172 SS1]|uniref:Uncharacterized protein n=1 Tax=Botryobasidium botryosum (strain FD-172 SS1) TaxID=930990 RepID=A0A067MXB2_BOTB1|nr:hypothetical protein BOTBODRAFT_64811 [Botryobasidium botryosum FD-172 SS1]